VPPSFGIIAVATAIYVGTIATTRFVGVRERAGIGAATA
jgi:hypothetical protein